MTLLALCCSAKINVASPLTINLKPWQTMTKKKKKNPKNQHHQQKNPKNLNNNKKEKHSSQRGGRKKRCEQIYFHRIRL